MIRVGVIHHKVHIIHHKPSIIHRKPGMASTLGIIFVFLFILPAKADALSAIHRKTAAEIDWVAKNKLSPERQKQVPAVCSGAYISPPVSLPKPLYSSDVKELTPDTIFGFSDQVNYQNNQGIEMKGHVRLQQGDVILKSISANVDRYQNNIALNGDVILRGKNILLVGDHADYQLNSGAFQINQASYLLPERSSRGAASLIKQARPGQLDIKEGTYTTCSPGDNGWSFAASDIHLNKITGVGKATNVRFRIKGVSVFYFPWFSFPIDNRRKSGFLYPSLGTSNVGRGMFFSIPYYFNLAPNYDLTLTPQYINGRGVHTEGEFRYLDAYSQSSISGGFISHDSEFSKTHPLENPARWGFKFDNSAQYGGNWHQTIDYNAVSDNNYLSDLGQSLSTSVQTYLNRSAIWTYSGDWRFSAQIQGYQTTNRTTPEVSRPYNRLPELSLSRSWDQGVLDWSWHSRYSFFYRNNSHITTAQRVNGSRLRMWPEVSLPIANLWGYITPKLKLDQTEYFLLDRLPGEKNHISRTVPFFTLDSGLYFDRDTRLFGRAYTQSLEPRLYYVYSKRVNQNNIPNFDSTLSSFNYYQFFTDDRFVGGDRIGDNDRVTLGLTSRFNESDTGIDRAVFQLGRVFYLQNRTVTLNGLGASTRHQSLWAGKLSLKPYSNLDINISGLWQPGVTGTRVGSSTLRLHSKNYRYVLNMGHRYNKNLPHLEQSNLSVIAPLTQSTSVFGRWLFDLATKRTIGTMAGVEYAGCCWRVQLFSRGYLTTDTQFKHAIMFRFELKGLSSLGAKAKQLDLQIPGYAARESYRKN